MNDGGNPCVISCGVLKRELTKLVETSEIDVDLHFLEAGLHYDYKLMERAIRGSAENNLKKHPEGAILIYGDVCLGFADEMKALLEEYKGLIKVDALNCIDCLLGGKGRLLETDPDHKALFLTPGWIQFWKRFEGSKDDLRGRYRMLDGIILLDSLGNLNEYEKEIEEISSRTGLPISQRKEVGLKGFKQVILGALEQSKRGLDFSRPGERSAPVKGTSTE